MLNPGTVIGKNTNIYPLSSVRGVIEPDSIYKSSGETVKSVMSVELWDVFDENGIPTGKTALRGRSVLAPGSITLSCIFG